METTLQKRVNVWDTYVTKKDGSIMHFDIIAPVDMIAQSFYWQEVK